MVLDDIFERFARQSPVTVMARAALEHALSPQAIDARVEQAAQRQYPRTLLSSSVVDLMGSVVAKIQPAVNAAYRARAEALGVSLRAVYDKIDRLEPGVSAELVRHTARTLGPVIKAMAGEREAWLPGYSIKILDGNHLAGTQHRLKELRATGAGALPGSAPAPVVRSSLSRCWVPARWLPSRILTEYPGNQAARSPPMAAMTGPRVRAVCRTSAAETPGSVRSSLS